MQFVSHFHPGNKILLDADYKHSWSDVVGCFTTFPPNIRVDFQFH